MDEGSHMQPCLTYMYAVTSRNVPSATVSDDGHDLLLPLFLLYSTVEGLPKQR